MVILDCHLLFNISSVACSRRQFNSPGLKYVEALLDRCVVASAHHLLPWDMHLRHILPHLRRPWSVQTLAHYAHPIVRRHLPSIHHRSQPATMPAIHWLVLDRWDQRETVDMHPAVHLCSRHQLLEWLRLYSSRRLDMGVRCRHRCMTFLSDHIFLVRMLACYLL